MFVFEGYLNNMLYLNIKEFKQLSIFWFIDYLIINILYVIKI